MTENVKNLLSECSMELNNIETIISKLDPFDKTNKYLTQYALIKASGTLEYAYRSIIADYFSRYNIPQIDKYLSTTIRESSSSVKYENICNILNKFDENWSKAFKTRMSGRIDGNLIIQASNSLVSNRHTFAHGNEPSATFNDIKVYYYNIIEMISELDSILV